MFAGECLLSSSLNDNLGHLKHHIIRREASGLVVEPQTPEREVGGSIPTSTVLCPSAKTHLLPEKYW